MRREGPGRLQEAFTHITSHVNVNCVVYVCVYLPPLLVRTVCGRGANKPQKRHRDMIDKMDDEICINLSPQFSYCTSTAPLPIISTIFFYVKFALSLVSSAPTSCQNKKPTCHLLLNNLLYLLPGTLFRMTPSHEFANLTVKRWIVHVYVCICVIFT